MWKPEDIEMAFKVLKQISRTANLGGSHTPLKTSFKNMAKYECFIIKCWKNSFQQTYTLVNTEEK